jgi:RNA polymerase sigma factor (sigma-70 family)
MTSSADTDGGEGYLADMEEVAQLFLEQSLRIRRMVRSQARGSEQLVEDACQLAWLRLVQRRARIRRETAPAWLVRTAIHEAFRQMRRDARDLSLETWSEEDADQPARRTPPLLDELAEQRSRLEAIGSLPERQQRLMWLQALGLTYTEMAGHTGTTRRTVDRQLVRARRALDVEAA